jgi:hypothetical protein
MVQSMMSFRWGDRGPKNVQNQHKQRGGGKKSLKSTLTSFVDSPFSFKTLKFFIILDRFNIFNEILR